MKYADATISLLRTFILVNSVRDIGTCYVNISRHSLQL